MPLRVVDESLMYAQVYKERDSKGKILAIHVRYSRVTSSRYFRPSLHFTGENGEHELRGEPERQVPKGRFPPDKIGRAHV